MLFLGALLAVYVVLILISFFWYRGASTQLSGFKIFYHLVLYIPLVFMAGNYLTKLQETAHIKNLEKNSIAKWQEIAETKQFHSEKLEVNFSYSTVGRGTFNTSYFEDIEVVETEDSVALVGIYEGKREFRGIIKKNPPALSNNAAPIDSDCGFLPAIDQSFHLSDGMIVKKFDRSLACYYDYIDTLDFSSFDFEFTPGDMFFIVDAANKQPKWLVITYRAYVFIGPLENNAYEEAPLYWFDTLRLGK